MKHIKSRRQLGLCAWGGCSRKSATYYCPEEHQPRANDLQALRREKARAVRNATRGRS